jgi:hypothetical protein
MWWSFAPEQAIEQNKPCLASTKFNHFRKNTSNPFILEGMELMQSKLPYLPPDWTVARGAKYVAKLTVFVIVPGLHQIVSKRRLFGGLLLAGYFAAEFVTINLPYDLSKETYPVQDFAILIAKLVQYVSWILLALDFKNLENRKPGINLFLIAVCAFGLYSVPYYNPGNSRLLVQNNNNLCPEFCLHDIIEYDYRRLDADIVSAGDYVLMDRVKPHPYISKILALPSKELCEDEGHLKFIQADAKFTCLPNSDRSGYFYPHLVLGGLEAKFVSLDGKDVSIVLNGDIQGINPRKIGNIREYNFLSDGITETIGRLLVAIYEMTGLNMFGISR